MGFGLRFRERLEEGTADEIDKLMKFLKQFLLLEHNEDGSHIVASPTTNVAAADVAYVTVGNTSSLTAERALVGTANEIDVTDNGANSTVAIGLVASPVVTGLTVSGLTSGRVPIAGTAGLLGDDADLTFSTDTLTTKGLVVGTTKLTSYDGIAAAGYGVPVIRGYGRFTAQTAAVASVASYTVGASDASFLISANVLITTSTAHNFTMTCAYTDEGNTARTLTLTFSSLAGTLLTAITNAAGAVPYEGLPLHIRAKAATAITIATTGTFTTVTYNVEGLIKQIAT